MQFTIICNILLFLGCYKLFGNWEVPIKLNFDPFKVVGGFPTLIDSFFETNVEKNFNFQQDPIPEPIFKEQPERVLPWKCSILESNSQCFSILTSSDCLPASQFSFSFWSTTESSQCFHQSKGALECKTPFQTGNLCENVVVGVQKFGNSTIFELSDVLVNTQFVQNYDASEVPNSEDVTSESISQCTNYTLREMVLAGGENDTDLIQLFPFGINSTLQVYGNLDCAPPFPSDIMFCNCKNAPECEVPILYSSQNATFCGPTIVTISHHHGFIYSVVVTSSESTSSTSQQLSVNFLNLPPKKTISNFGAKRGRFHCPSERSCILEIFYPFRYLNSLDLPHQIAVFVFSLFIGVIIANLPKNS